MTQVAKGLRLRRGMKAASPVVRHGVTRAGQVGVEFEHQGVKAWGRNETAARASWQVSNVGKRYQDGSGTAVGRRHVEKAAATATPARRPAQQMAKTGAQQSRRALVRSNAMPSIEAAPEPVAAAEQPVAKAGSWKTIDQREQSQRRARRWKNRGIAVATIGGGTLLAASGHHNPNGARNAYRIARRATKDAYPVREGASHYMVRFGEPGQGVRHTLGARSRYVRGQLKAADTGTKLAAGAFGAAAAGTGVAVTGRSVEGYHQRRINTRRRANAQRAITKASKLTVAGVVATGLAGHAVGRRRGYAQYHDELVDRVRGARWGEVDLTSPGGDSLHIGYPRGTGLSSEMRYASTKARRKMGSRNARAEQRQQHAVGQQLYGQRQSQRLAHAKRDREVTKADRYFDPEDKRQRRLGAYGAGAALVGADQVRRGTQSTRRASRSLTGAKSIGEYLAGHDVKSRGDQKALVVLAHNTERGAMLLNPRAAARIAGGAALIAGAGAVVRRGGDPRRRRWQ